MSKAFSGSRSLDRNNSFVRRTVSRTINNATITHKDVVEPDFINVITALEELYAQPDVMEMQQLDGRKREQVGQGGVFCVSTVNAESTQPSQTAADTTVRHTQDVIVKQLPGRLFDENGLAVSSSHGASSKFDMELRILSNPILRSSDSIIRLLGIGWEYTRSELAAPEPNLLLERAHGTLSEFLIEYPNLPIETKTAIARDTANGIAALHGCGVVHGDVKTENILMVESTRWVAKVADFSHSMLDTSVPAKLIGGTPPFNAPEWKQMLPSAELYKTDVFSFGLVLSCIFVGADVFEKFSESKRHGLTRDACLLNFEEMKKDENLREYITNLLYEVDDTDLASRREDIASIRVLLDLSLHEDSSKRDLSQIISNLTKHPQDQKQDLRPETVMSRLDSNIIAIPYQALNNTSQILKHHILKALETTANTLKDERNSTACYELCICYLSAFGTATDYSKATAWLIKACEREQLWARASVHRLLEAMQTCVWAQNFPVDDWLMSAAQEGSLIALESLKERNSLAYSRALAAYRKNQLIAPKSRSIHWPSISAKLEGLSRSKASVECVPFLNASMNSLGDTLLICAIREGRHSIAHQLLDHGADVHKINSLGENALHLLACLDTQEVEKVARRLFDSSIDWTIEARGNSINRAYEQRPTIAGCPLVRVASMNKAVLLDILFKLETEYEKDLNFRQRKLKEANLRKILAISCRQCYIDVIEVLLNRRPEILAAEMNTLAFWIDQRRYTLSALAIASCVSAKAVSGFNVPEKFWRAHAHGREYLTNLTRTLQFLLNTGVDMRRTACGGESNALFFAIRLGRTEAVEILLSIQRLSSRDNVRDNIFAAFGTAHVRGANIDGDTNPYPNHHQKIGMVRAISLSIAQGHRDIFRILLRTRDGEALKKGIVFPVYFAAVTTWRINRQPRWYKPKVDNMRAFFPGLEADILKYEDCYFMPFFRKKHRDHFYFSDGRLNYPLKYMTDIAMSVHRDIVLSEILLHELRERDDYEHYNWVPRNYLESCCLGEAPEFRAPLEAAAIGLWPALVQTLVDNGASPWVKKYWAYDDSKDSEKENPYFTFIFNDLLTGDSETPDLKRRLQGARCLLARTTELRDRLRPETVDDLHDLLKTSKHMLATDRADLHLEISALWSDLYVVFNQISKFSRSTSLQKRYHHGSHAKGARQNPNKSALAYVAAQYQNASALQYLLKLGFSADGGIWNRLTITPYDAVRGLTSANDGSARAQCKRMLEERGAHRGLYYLLEFHILLTVWILQLLVRLTISDIVFFRGMISFAHEYPSLIKGVWRDGYKEWGISIWWFIPLAILITIMISSVLLMGMIASITPFVICGSYICVVIFFLGRTAPKWLLKSHQRPRWTTTKSTAAILLHMLPWIWLLTYFKHDMDFEEIAHFMYGPTVTIIKFLHRCNAKPIREGESALSEQQQENTELEPETQDSGASEADNGHEIEVTPRHDRPTQYLSLQTLSKFISGPRYLILSIPVAAGAIIAQSARMGRLLRRSKPRRPIYLDIYRDEYYDDDEELRSLMLGEEYHDDVEDQP